MLKIKEDKWEEFKEKSSEFGFRLNQYGSAFEIKFQPEREYPNDYLLLLVWDSSKLITMETSNYRYSGYEIAGTELEILYDLIANGYVEKVEK